MDSSSAQKTIFCSTMQGRRPGVKAERKGCPMFSWDTWEKLMDDRNCKRKVVESSKKAKGKTGPPWAH